MMTADEHFYRTGKGLHMNVQFTYQFVACEFTVHVGVKDVIKNLDLYGSYYEIKRFDDLYLAGNCSKVTIASTRLDR